RLVDAGGEAGGGDVVAKDSAIHHLSEEGGLRDQFPHQVGDIFLAFRGEGFLIARTATEGDDDDLALFRGDYRSRKRCVQQSGAEGEAGGRAKKVAAAAHKFEAELLR